MRDMYDDGGEGGRTTNKEVLIRSISGWIYNRLYSIESFIPLARGSLIQPGAHAGKTRTGKHCLAMESSSATEINLSEDLGGTTLAGGMITSS